VRSVSASSQVNQHELALAGLFLHKWQATKQHHLLTLDSAKMKF
jgi:hypothetical protein